MCVLGVLYREYSSKTLGHIVLFTLLLQEDSKCCGIFSLKEKEVVSLDVSEKRYGMS